MSKDFIKEEVSKLSTMREVYSKARELKAEGYDIDLVNTIVSARIKELVAESKTGYTRLTKVLISSTDVPRTKVTQFEVKIENLNSPNVSLLDGVFIL